MDNVILLMRNSVIFLTLTTISLTSAWGQSAFQRKNDNFENLTGVINFLTVFVETVDGTWDSEEMNYYLNELQEGHAWIITEADRYHKRVEFNRDFFFMDNNSTIFLERVAMGDRRSIINSTIKKLGYFDLPDFIERTNLDVYRDKFIIMLLVKSPGRSHAYNSTSVKDFDLAVVYCDGRFGSHTPRSVMAHELLHQFGAWDLYHEYGRSQTEASAEKVRTLYPNSVMAVTRRNLEDLEVDEVTAWRLGWRDFKDGFNDFNPNLNQEKIREEEQSRNLKKSRISIDLKKKSRGNE